MCLCVSPEDHACVWCGGFSMEHFEDKYGSYCCSLRCKLSSNVKIDEIEAWDNQVYEDKKPRWLPCVACKKNQVNVTAGDDTCQECIENV